MIAGTNGEKVMDLSARPALRIFVNAWQPNNDPAEDVRYTITQNLNDAQIRAFRKDYLWAKPGEVFTMMLKLCDSTELDLKFRTDPIWIEQVPAGTNPEGLCANNPGLAGFTLIERKPKRIWLQNPMPGPNEVNYVYRLRIKDGAGQSRDFDPIVKNGGGTPPILDP